MYPMIPVQGHRCPELSRSSGCKMRPHPGQKAPHHRASHTHTHATTGQFRPAGPPHAHTLGRGRTPESLEITHTAPGRACTLHADSGPAGNRFFLSWTLHRSSDQNDVISGPACLAKIPTVGRRRGGGRDTSKCMCDKQEIFSIKSK